MLTEIYSKIAFYKESGYNFTLPDKIGLCVLYANKYLQTANPACYKITDFYLQQLLGIDKYAMTGIVSGSAGVLWLLNYLKAIDLLSFSEKDIYALEKITVDGFVASLNQNNWDYYYNGSIGHLLAIKQPEYCKLLLDFLLKAVRKNDKDNYELLSKNYPESTNLGLHAGILGVLSICNTFVRKGIFPKESLEIQKRALDIIFCKLEKTNYNYYPATVNADSPCRMCWTYGELTAAFQLLATGRLLGDKNIEQNALTMARKTTLRATLEDTMIYDSCIISGSSGNYILYKLLNSLYPDEIFGKAEDLWQKHTSVLLKRYDYHNIDRYTNQKVIDLSILGGLSGICLTLDNFNYVWLEYILLDMF
ncbi:MAG: hypothetical protein LBU22_00080 [Dysgonamonadaceae bacterium]|jgi:hypothetical protein|nr:hypothetical protein [Dysgonamonadaceae bacterium]